MSARASRTALAAGAVQPPAVTASAASHFTTRL
jgi:hypothetical protein